MKYYGWQRFLLILISVCLFSAACTSEAANDVVETVPIAELIARADQLYRERENPARLREAILLLKRARVADSQNFEAAWKLAKFNYFLGAYTKDKNLRDQAYKDCLIAAKSARQLEPGKPDGHFWYGACLGGQSKASLLSGAANINEIRENMKKVIEIQPDYQGAMAYVALAEVELATKGIMGGKAEKALEYLEKALELEKDNSFIYLNLGKAYLALKRRDEARQMLEKTINMPPHPDYAPERRHAAEEAQTTLDKKLKPREAENR